MNKEFRTSRIPPSRIATFDVFAMGLKKHHVAAMLEFDVTGSRKMLKTLRRQGTKISFNGWLLACIASVVAKHPEVAAFKVNKRKLKLFDDINITMLIEKQTALQKVPVPHVIYQAQKKSAEMITFEIEQAKKQPLDLSDRVLGKKPGLQDRLYSFLPGFLRRFVWRVMLASPGFVHKNMGNVAITSLGMTGSINGWFVHKSIHPLSFGVGSVIRKALVVKDEIQIREILNMTVLFDHDVIDGAPMVRFVKDLTGLLQGDAGESRAGLH